MEKIWKIKKENKIDETLVKKFQPVILRLLANRGITEVAGIEKFFNLDYSRDVLDPFNFSDMARAADRIIKAKGKREKIAIFGDYDADGVTATALLYETLKLLGFEDVIIYIPDRQNEGYGMNSEAIEYLKSQGVGLIITVDCGITNFSEAEKAGELGMDLIITDHHHVPEKIPTAVAIINPHMKNCRYAFQDLAGVGVAFKLAQALYQKIDPENIEQLKWLLDLVAVGTVADCVPVLGENRALVKYGLIVLSKTRRVGLQELFKVGRINIDENNLATTQKISFQIAPRINAAGRMDHANASYNLVIEKDRVAARDMALEIESKNQSRQKVTAEIVKEIRALAENYFKDKKLIVASNEHWQVGILGLVAGKISDEFSKPTMVLQKRGEELVGSLRSIPQVNIIEALEKCSGLLTKFGGHAQAAGVTVSGENFEAFCGKLSGIIEKELEGKEIFPEIEIDAEVSAEDVNWELMLEINKMEPFGEGNEEPVFLMKNMIAEDIKIVGNGSKHLKLALRAENNPKIFEAIGFGFGEKFSELKSGDHIDVVFNLQEDEWNGNKKMQLRLIDLKMKNMLK